MRLVGKRVVLRPPRTGDAAELLRQHRTPEVRRWWGEPDAAFPFAQEPGTIGLAMTSGDAPVGWIELWEEPDPDFRHAGIDLFVAPEHHRRGLGSDAIRTALAFLVARGHHRVTIDPCAENTAAVACYAALGFEPVGVTRRSWRDPDGRWRDGLLMEWLRPDLRRS